MSVQVPPERQKEEEIRIKRFVARIGYAIAELTGQVWNPRGSRREGRAGTLRHELKRRSRSGIPSSGKSLFCSWGLSADWVRPTQVFQGDVSSYQLPVDFHHNYKLPLQQCLDTFAITEGYCLAKLIYKTHHHCTIRLIRKNRNPLFQPWWLLMPLPRREWKSLFNTSKHLGFLPIPVSSWKHPFGVFHPICFPPVHAAYFWARAQLSSRDLPSLSPWKFPFPGSHVSPIFRTFLRKSVER